MNITILTEAIAETIIFYTALFSVTFLEGEQVF